MWFLTNTSLPPYCHHTGRCTWSIRFLWQKYLLCTLWNVLSTVSQLLRDYECAALMERFIGFRVSAPHGSRHSFPSFDFWAADARAISFFWSSDQEMHLPVNVCIPLKWFPNSLKLSPFCDSCLSDPSSPHARRPVYWSASRVTRSVTASSGNLSIRAISCIHSHLVGNSGKWNDICGATLRNGHIFTIYITVVLMQFRLMNLYQSFWLTVHHKANKQQFISNINQLHLHDHIKCNEWILFFFAYLLFEPSFWIKSTSWYFILSAPYVSLIWHI